MATYDNKAWLLKNIREAFIATDETGMCEITMAGEDLSKIFQNKAMEEKKRLREERLCQPGPSTDNENKMGDISEDREEREIVTQFDPYPDMEDSEDDDLMSDSYIRYEEFGAHRQRSNTAQWLDKKEQALRKAAKIKNIKWEESSTQYTKDQLANAFQRTDVKKPGKKKSLLTEQIENCPELPHRQYVEYAKFDGTAQLGLPTKTFKIFMTMLPEKHQNYPVVVCVIASAKIKDLIGFTCYKYSIENPDIPLGSVHDYGLCIAEDDGEVDYAFPCLDANEPCSKFGFTCLGLVELKSKNLLNQVPGSITEDSICLSGAFHVFPKETAVSGQSHQIPSRHNTGGSATSEAVMYAIQSVNEEKRGGGNSDLDKIQSHIMATEAPQYKVYKVQMLRKVRANTAVQLSICLDRIEVEPLVMHKHAFFSRPKYSFHNIDSVAWCQILEAKANKTTFRIVYSPNHSATHGDRSFSGSSSFFHPNTTYKHHDFECDHDVAKEIVEKVNTILDLRNSPCRREYKTAKEKKLQGRRTFHTKHMLS